ncbi:MULTISPECIES: FtsX-like permease family protein [unclassified Leeuwenhoekiella]|uniref:ABC transporter permease n=1 Tax=unclassified Leeuwenhoekiella TaxID=2615029 RepID=UPI0025C3736D|nr:MULTISPECIES: FtsX-like permease family protein [unclassified Leeuwenhoekiella]|tara:strand:- start:6407 stop:8956 length:2550 start_codon:yes stop_codon:yes gene_type:complete
MSKSRGMTAGAAWLFKMAWRDFKASAGKLSLFMVSIVLGVAAIVSIQSFGETLKDNIALQSKALMGADFKIDSDNALTEEALQIVDSLGGADAEEISFASMALFPKNGATKLLQVRGITSGFPFYGEIETQPATAGRNFGKLNGALVDATVMLQLDIEVGDTVKLGAVRLPVVGELKNLPGSNAVFSAIAPPVVIPYSYVEQTGLVQLGSRIDYEYYFKAPQADMQLLEDTIGDRLDAAEADLDTHTSTSDRLGRRYENFGKFLNLVGFVALLLGCVGIASATTIYIREKLRSVAVLKCLGATRKQAFLIYLIQIAAIGLLGGILGTVAGLALQQVFPVLLEGLLPVDVQITWSLPVIILGIFIGMFMSVLFALYPLLSTLYVSPLQTLRFTEDAGSQSRSTAILVSVIILLFIFLFSLWLLGDWRYALAFLGGIVVTFSILAGIARLFMRLLRRYFPSSWSFTSRQSLRNLFRPRNQTVVLVLAIGVGSFLISTLYFTKDMLLAQANLDSSAQQANMILLDVQRDQMTDVAQTLKANDLKPLDAVPIVTMRVHSINGRNVADLKTDTTSQTSRWILNHEFRTTYRDSLIGSESLKEGTFTPRIDAGTEPVPVSVSDNFAKDAVVAIGDRVTFNVQGRLLETTIGSIRLVDWSRLQLNFSVVFPAGVLEQAPQFGVITTQVPNSEVSASIQPILVEEYPNVSILDLRQVLNVIEGLLTKISYIINFMAFFSILIGIIVLLGAVRTSKYQRIRESVLLRTMGAKSKQILRIQGLEYLYLGLLGSLSGILLSLIGSLLLAYFAFDTTFIPSWVPFGVLLPGITALVVVIGLANSRSVIRSSPLEVLRKEAR